MGGRKGRMGQGRKGRVWLGMVSSLRLRKVFVLRSLVYDVPASASGSGSGSALGG